MELSDLASQCIHCGFCLESCPTFLETGSEVHSPRGRIHLARLAEQGEADWIRDASPALETCLGCRSCETACPSGVQYGAILEAARSRVLERKPSPAVKILADALSSPPLAALQIGLSQILPGPRIPSLVSWALSGAPPEAAPPRPQRASSWPPLNVGALPPVKERAAFLDGCVMRALFPRVHEASKRLLRRVGLEVLDCDLGCCGALHSHIGLAEDAEKRARALASRLLPDVILVVDSAGCGSSLKALSRSRDPELQRTARQVRDISEVLLEHGLVQVLASSPGLPGVTAAYHDACHLAHGQGVRSQPRTLLSAVPGLELIPLPESDACCGSAGIYNLTQPAMARRLLDRKIRNAESTGAGIIVAGNPGCHAWIDQGARERGGRMAVHHTCEVLEASFSGLPSVEETGPVGS